MTTKQAGEQLAHYNTMVHGLKDFAEGQLHKLTWEDECGEYSMFFEYETTIEGLIWNINWQLKNKQILNLPKSDLIVNYR